MTLLLTDIGDGSVTLPMAIAVALILAAGRQWRPALGWVLGVGSVWAAMLMLKFAGYAMAMAYPDSVLSTIDLVTPSGHVASASVIYGGLAGLLLRRPGTLLGRVLATAAVVAVVVGITRVRLDFHSVSEVIIGGGVGLVGGVVLAAVARTPVAWSPPPSILTAAAAAVIFMAGHDGHMSLEGAIRQAATEAIDAWHPAAPPVTPAPRDGSLGSGLSP